MSEQEPSQPGAGTPAASAAGTPVTPPGRTVLPSGAFAKRPCPNCGEMLYSTEARCWKCRTPVPVEAVAQPVPMPTAPPVAAGVGAAKPLVSVPSVGPPPALPLPPGYGTAPPPPVARPARVGSAQGDQVAIWALVCGILGFVCCQLLGPVAIVLGVKAKNQGSTSGFATAGIVLGILACLVVVVQIVVIALPMLLVGGP